MVTSTAIENTLSHVNDQVSFIQTLLRETLGWPIEANIQNVEDLSYEWTTDELNAPGLNSRIVNGRIYQIQPIDENPWGVFIVEFKNPDVFTRNRGLTGPLRTILRTLVPKKRRNPALPAFKREHLLFICTNRYKHYRFAYFKSPLDTGQRAPLATFGWNPGEPMRTVSEYNLKPLEWPRTDTTSEKWISMWASAFDVEKVTKEFYKDLTGSMHHTEDVIRTLKWLQEKEVRIFTQNLYNRLMFIRFIEKKGWASFNGDGNLLNALAKAGGINGRSLYQSRIRPLFFDGFATLSKQESPAFGSVPFLNGGLFEETELDQKVIDIPDEAFKPIFGDLGLLYRYNFTVEESTPLNIQVAVDPEMLGKVFENLLEVKDRKSKGTYYTPREIVHYMCQESLINYLATELELVTGKDDLETLIKYGETVIEHDTRVANVGHETDTYSFKLPESIRQNAKLIDEKLASIRVCDPAVGSGAFPVGMMNEIVRARGALTPHIGKDGKRSPYHFKRHAIQECLYGVDIDPGAVEIAKLRLWLSLVVDEEDRKTIQPLPNLDYKLVCGNSLLSVEKNLFNADLFNKLEKLKPLYFDETNPNKKGKFKEQINNLISQITNGHEDFDFEIYFSEVFHEKQGFDVVIANPPYVSYGLRGGQKMSETDKTFLRTHFSDSAEYKISLYAIFMDKGLQLAKPDGGLETYIVPDSFLLGRYFSKIRGSVLNSSHINYILLLPFSVFNATVGFSVVYSFQKTKHADLDHKLIAQFAVNNEDVGSRIFKHYSYAQNYFTHLNHNRFRLFFNEETKNLVSRIESGSARLGDFTTGRTGVRSLIGQKQIVGKAKKDSTWQKGLTSGSQILKYKVHYESDYINIDPSLLNKGGWDHDVIQNPKILVRQTGDGLISALDFDGYYHLNNIHSFAPRKGGVDLRYHLAMINSRLLDYYYKTIALETDRAMAQTDIETLEDLPIKDISNDRQSNIVSFVDKILAITKDDDYLSNPAKQAKVHEYEREIDQLVYKLYGLTPEEIRIVEGEG